MISLVSRMACNAPLPFQVGSQRFFSRWTWLESCALRERGLGLTLEVNLLVFWPSFQAYAMLKAGSGPSVLLFQALSLNCKVIGHLHG